MTCRWGPDCAAVCRKHDNRNPFEGAVGGDMIRYPLKGHSAYSAETSRRGT